MKRLRNDAVLETDESTNRDISRAKKKMQQPTTEDVVNMDPVEAIPLPPAVVVPQPPLNQQSRYVNNMFGHMSFKTNTGAILQYVTNQCNDAPGLIGAIRMPVSDPMDIGGYVTENWLALKEIGRSFLEAHMKRSNHHIGIGENLTQEDYSFGVSVATVSPAARMMNPFSRPEAGMWALQTPTLLDPVRVDIMEEGRRLESWQLIINGYIHLNEMGRRANVVARTIRENGRNREHDLDDRRTVDFDNRRNADYSTYPNRGGRGGYRGRQPERGGQRDRGERGGREERGGEDFRLNAIDEQIQMAIRENLRKQREAFPPTPEPTRPLAWTNTGVPLVPPARP